MTISDIELEAGLRDLRSRTDHLAPAPGRPRPAHARALPDTAPGAGRRWPPADCSRWCSSSVCPVAGLDVPRRPAARAGGDPVEAHVHPGRADGALRPPDPRRPGRTTTSGLAAVTQLDWEHVDASESLPAGMAGAGSLRRLPPGAMTRRRAPSPAGSRRQATRRRPPGHLGREGVEPRRRGRGERVPRPGSPPARAAGRRGTSRRRRAHRRRAPARAVRRRPSPSAPGAVSGSARRVRSARSAGSGARWSVRDRRSRSPASSSMSEIVASALLDEDRRRGGAEQGAERARPRTVWLRTVCTEHPRSSAVAISLRSSV